MDPAAAKALVDRIADWHEIHEDGKRAYFEVLLFSDLDTAAPIVEQMLAQNEKPFTSDELARKIARASEPLGPNRWELPPEPEEQRRRMAEGLRECDTSWMSERTRERLGLR